MKWNKYTLKATTEAEDIISNMMMEAGIEGIEIEGSSGFVSSQEGLMRMSST